MDETIDSANLLKEALSGISGVLTGELTSAVKEFTKGFLSEMGVSSAACSQLGISLAKQFNGAIKSLGGLSGMLSSLLSPMTLVVAGIAAVAGAFAS